MPCNDCSRTLNCPPCPYGGEGPEGTRRHENGAPCDSKVCDRYHVFDEPTAPEKGPDTPSIHKWATCSKCGHREHPSQCREGDTIECGCPHFTPAVEIAENCRRWGGCPKHPPIKDPPPDPEPPTLWHSDGQTCKTNECERWHSTVPPADPESGCPHGPKDQHCFRHHSEMCCFCDATTPTPEEEEEAGCAHCGSGGHAWTECEAYAELVKKDAPSSRRPPVAVAYAAEGQEPYEVLVPGDAIVAVQDGRLVITHERAFITAVLQVRPWGQPDA